MSQSMFSTLCHEFEISDDQWCMTTSLNSLRTGQSRSPCDPMFPLFRSHAISAYRSVFTEAVVEQFVWRELVPNAVGRAICVLGCGMPWWTPRGCLPTECIARNAMSMPALGVNVVSIGASILMSSFSSKNKKETSHRTDSAVSHAAVVRDTTRAATCALAWELAGVSSFHWGELGLRCCRSVWQHACVQPLVRWHGESLVCKITRRTPLSPNSFFKTTKWETPAPQLLQKL